MSLEPRLVHISRTSMTLRWSVDAGAEGYEIHRTRNGPDEEEVLLAYVHTSQPMFADPGLAPGTMYRYRIVEALLDGEVREAEEWQGSVRTQPETEFQSVEEFVTKFIAPTFRRQMAGGMGVQWCDEWWRHEEAYVVLQALWWSYEAQAPALPPEFPTKSRADFLVYHCYPLLGQLFSKSGTFGFCNPDRDHHDALLNRLAVIPNPTTNFPAPFEP